MKIVIGGAGDVGTHLAKLLSNGQHDVYVVDEDDSKLRRISSRSDVMTLNGSPTSIETLKENHLRKADLFIAVTPYEARNITACMLAKMLGTTRTIARVNGPEYVRHKNQGYFNSVGVDSLIYPEILAAKEVTNLLKRTGTTKVFEFSGGKLTLFAVQIEKHAPIIGKSLREVSEAGDMKDYRVVAITRNGDTVIPRGDFVFKENDLAYIITNKAGQHYLLEYSGKKDYSVKNIMILGGSRIGKKIAQELESSVTVKMLEMDQEKSFKLADVLDKTTVIHADGRNVEVLLEEDIQEMDAFIAVTGNSEINILSCLYAKNLGVRTTIAEIENLDYINLSNKLGIDAIINKKTIAASHIFSFTMDAEVSSVRCLNETDAEALEFVVHENAKITRGLLSAIKFPNDAIIGGIIRGKTSFIATGDCHIRPWDKVVVFALPSAIKKVERFFK